MTVCCRPPRAGSPATIRRRRATRTLVAIAEGRLADRVRMVEECAALVERHVELLVCHGLAAAHDRQQQHGAGFRWVVAVARSAELGSADRTTADRTTADRTTADRTEAGSAPAGMPEVKPVWLPVPRPRRPVAAAEVVAVAAGHG